MSDYTVQIDATALYYRQILLPQTQLGWLDARQVQTLQLAAGTYSVQVQSGVYTDFAFTVTPLGTIDFDPAFDALASGRDSALLTLVGLEVSFDASELAHGAGGGVLFASIPMGSDPWLLVHTCRMLPQPYYMVQQGSGVVCNLFFAIGIDGRFVYDPTFDAAAGGCLSGAGTPALRFHGFPVEVDVSAVSRLLGLPDIGGLPPTWTGALRLRVLPADFFRVQIDQGITGNLFSLGIHGEVTLATTPDGMRLALDAPDGAPRVRALPLPLPAPGPLTYLTDDFLGFKIVVGSDADGAQSVSMVMSDGRVAWLFDRRWFAGQPTLGVRRRFVGPLKSRILTVTLTAARFPGTDLPADFTLQVSRLNSPDGVEIDVELGWSFGSGQYSSDVNYDGTATASLTVGGNVCGVGPDQTLGIVATAPVTVQFRPGFIALAAPGLAQVSGPAGVLGVASLQLTLLPPTDRVLFAADVAPPLRSRLTLGSAAPWRVLLPTLHTPVGELHAVADLYDNALAEVGENLDGRRRQAVQYATRSLAQQYTLTLGGGLGDAAGQPVVVSLARGVLRWFFDGTPAHAELHAGAVTDELWLPVGAVGIRLGARTLEPTVSNFAVAFDGTASTLLACDLPYSSVAAAPADCIAEAAAVRGLLSVVPASTRPDAAKLRNWLQLGATAAEATLVLRDVALAMLRSADLFVLRLDFTNMALSAGAAGPPTLAPALPGVDGTLVASFAPQHLVEPSFTDVVPAPPLPSRLAEPSRLAFAVPAGRAAIALDSALFDWSAYAQRLNEPLTDGPPSALQTLVELPYRLGLSPGSETGWTPLPALPSGERYALATTRLGVRRNGPHGPFIDERDSAAALAARRLRAVTSPDDIAAQLPADPIANLMDGTKRRDIVENTKLGRDEALIDCRRLMLASLGGWLEAEGHWNVALNSGMVAHWLQHVAMGRDQKVEVTQLGWLLPWGHRAALVSVAERHFGAGPVGPGQNSAYLIEHDHIVITQRLRHFPSRRDLPFTEAEMLIGRTPEISPPAQHPVVAPYAAGSPFWVFLPNPAGGDDLPMHFPMHLRDLDVSDDARGRLVEVAAMAIFVPDGFEDAKLDDVITAYNLATAYGWQDFSAAPKRIAFAPPQSGGHADLDTFGLQFGIAVRNVSSLPLPGAAADPDAALPRIANARVRLSDAAQLAHLPGDGTVDISYFADYVKGDNPAGVFANLLAPVALQFGGANGSGLATPDMVITGLSQSHGPLGGDLSQLAAAVPSFNPVDFFGQAAPQLFGGVSLLDVLPSIDGGAALDAAPRLVTTRSGTQVEIAYDWMPYVTSSTGAGVTLSFDAAPAGSGAVGVKGPIQLHSSLKLRPSADPESLVIATVDDFKIGFAGLVSVAVRRMQLTQRSGRKPELSFALADLTTVPGPLRLLGNIDFLQPLLEEASKLLGTGPSVTLAGGVLRVGYALALPNLGIGVFNLENIRIGVGLAIPLDAKPLAFDFNFGEKDHHFLVTVAFVGGGGFFAIEVGADGPRSIELAVEVAASVALDLGVASGSAHVAVGVYMHYVPTSTEITGFVRAGGELTVLGILSLHVELYLGLTYQSSDTVKVIWGEASLMVEVSLGCLSKSVTVSMRREFIVGGNSGAAQPAQLQTQVALPLPGVERAFGNSRDDWQVYFASFA